MKLLSFEQELLFELEQIMKYFVLMADLLLPKITKNGAEQVLLLDCWNRSRNRIRSPCEPAEASA